MVISIMNEKQMEYNKKYRKNKKPLYIWVNANIYREFKNICVAKGFKVNFIATKMLIDFNKKNCIESLN